MLPITKKLITNSSNRPKTKLKKLKGLIIHWTANTGANAGALAHYNFFQNHNIKASAHYFVDDKTILQIIPDNEVAYHVGANSFKPIGNTIKENGLSPNYFLIGIEMCVNTNSDWDTTYKNTIELTRYLLNKYNLSAQNVWRHYDITGKDCPKMMCYEEDEGWTRFKNILLTNKFPNESKTIGKGISKVAGLNVRMGNGTYFKTVGTLQKDEKVSIYESIGEWYRIGKGKWVSKAYITAQATQPTQNITDKGIVNTANLNVRNGASTNYKIVGKLQKGDAVNIYQKSGDWYHIGDNRWVHSYYIDIIKKQEQVLFVGIVTATKLNVRSGAGTNQPVTGAIKQNDTVNVYEERNGWYRIGEDDWVSKLYIMEKFKKQGKVIASLLNVRSGPGVEFAKVKQLTQNDKVIIEAAEADWYKTGKNEWVHSDYVQIIQL
ncbi:MAG: SH3 domain-containing protein [Niabella sp.]